MGETSAAGAGQPRLIVCRSASLLLAVRAELAVAGWTLQHDLTVPDQPWSREGEGLACTGTVTNSAQLVESVTLLLRGITVAVEVADADLARDLWDQGRRVAVAELFDDRERPVADGLSAIHLELLLRMSAGDVVARAARHCHLSERTAARRLAEARRALGARTTAEAAVRVAARLHELRPHR